MQHTGKPTGPLAGFRVADFTWIGAGAYTTRILADFGADVIKVESATRLDPLRLTPPFKDGVAGLNRSGYFADRNCNKRAIQLNLKTPEGVQLARQLIRSCDIVANNFSPGVMEKLGLGYDDIAAEQPDIIYLAMSMQGATGPQKHHVGFGLTIASLSGLLHLSGDPDGLPIGTGTNYPDHVPNPCHAAFAVLAALRHRRRTGLGQYIDLAQTEPTVALLGVAVTDYLVNNNVQHRVANHHPSFTPHGVYPCKNRRWIAIAIQSDAQWQALCKVLGILATTDAPNPPQPAPDTVVRNPLDDLIGQYTVRWDAHELERLLLQQQVAAGAVSNIEELMRAHPQLEHRSHWVRLDHPEMGSTIYNAPPIRLSRTNFSMQRAAPCLGEHTDEICQDILGYDALEITELRRAEVLK